MIVKLLVGVLCFGGGVWLRGVVDGWRSRRFGGYKPRQLYEMGYQAGRQARRRGVPEVRACDRFVDSAGVCARCDLPPEEHKS